MSEDVAELPPGLDRDRLVDVVAALGAELAGLGAVDLAQLDGAGRHHRLQLLIDQVRSQLDALGEIVELGFFAQVGPGTVLGTESVRRIGRDPR
jgi:hypothetical protein